MAYYDNGTYLARDNRAQGSPAGRENLVSGTAGYSPARPVETGLNGAVKTVTGITRSSQTATVDATAHGITAGQIFRISGAVQPQYNGEFKALTVADANTITYEVFGSPVTTATGTIKLRKVRTANRDGK